MILLIALATFENSLQIFHIGNSLTWDSAPQALSEVPQSSASIDVENGWHIRCGSSLSYILNNPTDVCVTPTAYGTWDQALHGSNSWDALSFQPFPGSGSTFASDINAIQTMADQCFGDDGFEKKVFVYSGWPWKSDNGFAEDWLRPAQSEGSQPTLLSASYVEQLVGHLRTQRENAVYLIPAGEVIYNLGRSLEIEPFVHHDQDGGKLVFDSAYSLYRDQYHMDLLFGRYVAFLTMHTCVTGELPKHSSEILMPNVGNVPIAWHQRVEKVIRSTVYSSEWTGLRESTDIDGDGQIGLKELLELLTSWGPCLYCDQDFNRDGRVGYAEVIRLMSNWGSTDL